MDDDPRDYGSDYGDPGHDDGYGDPGYGDPGYNRGSGDPAYRGPGYPDLSYDHDHDRDRDHDCGGVYDEDGTRFDADDPDIHPVIHPDIHPGGRPVRARSADGRSGAAGSTARPDVGTAAGGF